MIKWIGDLRKEYHHVMIHGEMDHYEPTMVILNHKHPGKSFQITLSAFWKYNEPYLNEDAAVADRMEYEKLRQSINFKRRIAVTDQQLAEFKADMACCLIAEAYSRSMRFMLCLGYNLAKCMQMFEIRPDPSNAAQLLLWIQDGLDDLKNMPPAPLREDEFACGEVEVWEGSKKITDQTLTVKESDLVSLN